MAVARAWAGAVGDGDLDTGLALYAPDAVIHTDGGDVSGRDRLRAHLASSGPGTHAPAEVRGTGSTVTVTWPATADGIVAPPVRSRVEHGLIAEHFHCRRCSGVPEPGEWRHGDLPAQRPDHFERPVQDGRLVRHKTFALEELTPDEAAFDMEQLDYDFHLFRDLASGEDALLERRGDEGYHLTRLRPLDVDPGPTAISLTVADHPPAAASVADAVARLDAGGEPFVFFQNAGTGRGNVVYRRYDGHYGLVTPE
jgi:hypothetical protein